MIIDPNDEKFQETYFSTISAQTKKRRKKSMKDILDEFGIERIN